MFIRPRVWRTIVLSCAFSLFSSLVMAADIRQGGFQTPDLQGAYAYGPSGTAWTFSGGAGISGNGSAFTNLNPDAPRGDQVLFLQNGSNCVAGQYIAPPAGQYLVRFMAAQRKVVSGVNQQNISVRIDGTEIAQITPGSEQYAPYSVGPVTLTGASQLLQFVGLNTSGDHTALLDEILLEAYGPVRDADFELPDQGSGFLYRPTGGQWFYAGGAGLAGNGSAFTNQNPNAPDGDQVLFLQGGQAGYISQTIVFPKGLYQLEFQAAQRKLGASVNQQTVSIRVDGVEISQITPVDDTYAGYASDSFMLDGRHHLLQVVGLNPLGGDNTMLIDSIAVVPYGALDETGFEVPEQNNGFTYGPSGSAWTFTGASGIAGNGSGFTNLNPDAPEGDQVLFLQGTGYANQTISYPNGRYRLRLQAAQRKNNTQTFVVTVDGAEIARITPADENYAAFLSDSFRLSPGSHLLELKGINPLGTDNTALIDALELECLAAIGDKWSDPDSWAFGSRSYRCGHHPFLAGDVA